MLSNAAKTTVPVWLTGPIAVAALFLILLQNISKSLENEAPVGALALDPFNAQARLRSILERSLPESDPAAATRELSGMLLLSVGDARYYSLLGTLARLQNKSAESDRLIDAALVLNPTEPNASFEQINSDIAAGNYFDALKRADVYVRKGALGSQTIAGHLVQLVRSKPDARNAVFAKLAANAPWRSAFLRELFRTQEALGLVPEALTTLARSQNPPTDPEVNAGVSAFLAAGDIGGAYRLFLMTRNEAARRLVSLVYDPEFKAAPTGNPFDWDVADTRAVEVRLPASSSGGVAIAFAKRPAVGFGLSQKLTLAPGKYKGTIDATAASLVAPDSVFLYVRCGAGRTLEKVDIPTGGYENRTIAFRFEVPPAKCDLQTIGLASGQLFEHWSRLYSGELTVNSIRVGAADE